MAYAFEMLYDLMIASEDNVSQSPVFEACELFPATAKSHDVDVPQTNHEDSEVAANQHPAAAPAATDEGESNKKRRLTEPLLTPPVSAAHPGKRRRSGPV